MEMLASWILVTDPMDSVEPSVRDMSAVADKILEAASKFSIWLSLQSFPSLSDCVSITVDSVFMKSSTLVFAAFFTIGLLKWSKFSLNCSRRSSSEFS